MEERGRNPEPGGPGAAAVGGSLGNAGRGASGGNLGAGGSLGTYGSGGSYGDWGVGGSSGGTSPGTGGTSSGTGGTSGTAACPRMPPLCEFWPGCLDPSSPSPEHVRRNPLDTDAGTRDAAPPDAATPVDGGLSPPVFTVSAKLCGDAGAARDPSFLAFDVVNKWTSTPAVAVLSGNTACGGAPLGQISVPFPAGLPWGAQVTHCIRAPRELGTILTLVPIGATEVSRPRFVSGCECPRVLTPSSSVCSIEVPGGSSACEGEP